MSAVIHAIGVGALIIACIGVASSSIFVILTLAAAAKFRPESEDQRRCAEGVGMLPPVSLLKPVHGAETRMKENIESFFRQDYPDYEILFAPDEESDRSEERR